MNMKSSTNKLVLTAVMAAIILMMAFVIPIIGYIPLGFMNATTLHIPVIIGAIMLGPKSGAFLGLVFGITSLIKNTMTPLATSFVFSPFIKVGAFGGNFYSLIICLVPRILIGVVAYYVYKAMKRLLHNAKNKELSSLLIAGIAGSITNTLLVMNFIFLFFGQSYAVATERAYETLYGAILFIILVNGVPEAIVAAVLTAGICKVLMKIWPEMIWLNGETYDSYN